MARLLKITYASFSVGLSGDASCTLAGKYRLATSYTEFALTFEVVVRSATRSTFLTAEAALIAAYSKPDQALEVQLGGTDRHDYDPSNNTGFNARPSLRKIGDADDTANSARYECSVTVQLPASLTGRSGRQSSTVSVDATPAGKRTVTIEGAYTALSSNSAVAQYVAAGTTYCDSVITAVGGTYDLLTPVNAGSGFAAAAGFNYDDQNKVLRFRRVYRESIYNESQSSAAVSGVREQSLVVSRRSPPKTGEPSADVSPLVEARGSFSCFVDKNVTTDLETLWTGTLYPHVVAEIGTMGGGTAVVTDSSVTFDRTENRIEATVDALVPTGSVISARVEVEDRIVAPLRFEPVWSGDPFAVDQYTVPALHLKVITRTVATLGPAIVQIPPVSGFVEIERLRDSVRDQIGSRGQAGRTITISRDVFVFRRVNVQNSGQSGGSRTRDLPQATPAGDELDARFIEGSPEWLADTGSGGGLGIVNG